MTLDNEAGLDGFTRDLLDEIAGGGTAPAGTAAELAELHKAAEQGEGTAPIVRFFGALRAAKREQGSGYEAFGFSREQLLALCAKHVQIDEHCVTVGGRVGRALEVMAQANPRVEEYLALKDVEAPSGIELWDQILENQARIKKVLKLDDATWNSFSGQLGNAINDVETLAKCIDLPADAIRDVTRVTAKYRMRLTPYYASLIQRGVANDPVLLQAVPTAEMVDNVGLELPPVASDHSPARLIDQFYPRVVAVKVTNICAMYCTHCLRIAHIGNADRTFSKKAYGEALDYIAANERIRDVLITGGDAFMLNNENLRWLLGRLDEIDHVRMKRLGTRVPVTTPQRVDSELLDILEESNDKGPVRVVTQINTAQEITPVSKQAFKDISRRVMAVLNQAVLMRGINDSKPKMWKLVETIQEAYVRPYYVFNCSYRNPQYTHMRVPVEKGRDIIEGMYGNISGDAIPRYIAAAGGKVPLHRDNLVRHEDGKVILRKPWSGEETAYPDAVPELYNDDTDFAFNKYGKDE